ncbi:LuxR C-terminal-related transcriptional regulator [Streptomyces shenzhenensis]|uniref:LuxR C-terminal-related transcriptional regulator n=1 Tax=Streptomyces shenzhenensis TaxID=943815 RepID=UPI00381202C6
MGIGVLTIRGHAKELGEFGPREPGEDPGDQARRLVAASATRSLLLAVDEMDLLAPESRAFVREVVRLAHTARIKVLLTGVCAATVPSIVDELRDLATGRTECVLVRSLGQAAVAELARARGLGPRATALADEIHPVTGGNPGLTLAMLDEAAFAVSRDPDAPNTLDGLPSASLARRLREHACREVLNLVEAVAVLDAQCTPERLWNVLEKDAESVCHATGPAIASGIVRPDMTLHPYLRDAVLQSARPATLRSLRLRAAQVLHEQGVPAWEIAPYLHEAGMAPQPWAGGVLYEAAEHASRLGRHRLAAHLLESASSWGSGPDLREEVGVRITDMVWWMDPALTAPRLRLLAAAASDGTFKPGSLARLSRHLARHGEKTQASDMLRLAEPAPERDTTVGAVSPGDAAEGTADVRAEVQRTLSGLWLRHLFPEACPDAPAPGDQPHPQLIAEGFSWLSSAQRLPWLLAPGVQCADAPNSGPRPTGSAASAKAAKDAEAAVTCAEEILQSANFDYSSLEPMLAALFCLMATGRLDPLAPWYAALADTTDDERMPPPLAAMLSVAEAVAAWWKGDLVAVQAAVRRGFERWEADRWGVLAGLPRGLSAMMLTEQGRFEEAAAELAHPMSEADLASPYGLVYLRARGRFRLATGALRAAVADFRSCGTILDAWGMEMPGLVLWRLDLAEALLKLNEYAEAAELIDEQLALSPDSNTRARGIALRLLVATVPLAGRALACRKSIAVLQSCGDELEYARALGQLAQIYKHTGDLAGGRKTMRLAEKTARGCGAQWALAEMSGGSQATRKVPPPEAWDGGRSLTPAEWNVARMAAQGYTNREIAESLYVTASTVEQHLTRIYRKLGIKRRDEIAAIVGSHGAPDRAPAEIQAAAVSGRI